MRKLIYLLVTLSACGITHAQQAKYWQQQADYKIAANLNDKENTLDGFETISYTNHSFDSLSFLWIHVWPNAFKNDKTAYSEQKLAQGDSKFYFSNIDDRGYINNLDFKVNGSSLVMEDHPQYIDIVKILLPKPLAPGDSVSIQTPFHIKIPRRFSRMGRDGQYYSFTQWYPKVAVYDKKGWHEMPYLEWGEYYNDFGNYDVSITLPSNYVVAATGMLHDTTEKAWMKQHNQSPFVATTNPKKKNLFVKPKQETVTTASSQQTKTLRYYANHVTDFAWFTSKDYIVKYDTISLNNRIIEAWNFVLPPDEKKWRNSMLFTKNSIRFYSSQAGDYPFAQVSVVGDPRRNYEGMEYPMVTILNTGFEPERELDIVIAHEIGHNWFQEILASNERDHAWMDEGMNTYIENKYRKYFYPKPLVPKSFIGKKLPADDNLFVLDQLYSSHTDLPMDAPSETYPFTAYNSAVYTKTGEWMEKLEKQIGTDSMKLLMHAYFSQWKLRHPYPGDFSNIAETFTGRSLREQFELIYKKGPLEKPSGRKTVVTGLFDFSNWKTKQFIGIAPAIGYNNYDKFEIGLSVHNYNIPANKFQFVATPMFATGSKQPVGYARVSYDFYPEGKLQKIQLYAGAARFNTDYGTGFDGGKVFKAFSKIAPGVYFEWKKKNAISPITKWADFRTYFIGEQQLEQKQKPAPADSEYYTAKTTSKTTIIPQLSLGIKADRELYPWDITLQVQQVQQIVRTSISANYFLNYNEEHEGVAIRFFFGKIFYTQTKTDLLRSQNSRYHFTMYAPNGEQDYTYSIPFAERNQSTEFIGRQISMRDGGFKYRSDYSSIQPGLNPNTADYFDNWLTAANFTIDIPRKINPLSALPFKVPLKIFADIGTSASPWQQNSDIPKFLYSIGLQLPLFKVINLYYPLIESEAFKEPNSVNDPFKAGGPNWWQKRLTFSIDLSPLKKAAQTLVNL